ncbi:Ff.00g120280.m01.CDS01 [Fusarium sp. VM40]|nr:Ff.00g120280.m01.CDS01 [Fusarium sp. VM40]
MAPPFPRSSIELDYPLYAVDFDPEDSTRVVVGGGGGAGRSGVGNKISVLETVSQTELRTAGEINLSRDEDSVMSLAVGPHKGKTTYIYAGVNSSPDSIAKGTNEHLRTLSIDPSKLRTAVGAKTPDSNITEVARTSLFKNPDIDTYQRLLRVVGTTGAAATAMGKEPQLAIFDVAGAQAKIRGILELEKEAEDLDIVQTGESEFQVAYCSKYELYLVNVSAKETSEPKLVYVMPEDHGERPMFRAIRYLSPNFLVAAANLPKRSGVVIQAYRLPKGNQTDARLSINARIPRKISATALAVANLSPPASPLGSIGDTQFIIAIAGHDSSISLYTLDHNTGATVEILSKLWHLYTLKDVHGTDNITGVSFSHFETPKNNLRQQFIKLASTSLQKTVAVHSIPLERQVDKAPRNKKGPPRPVRYVTAMKSRGISSRGLGITMAIFALIMALVAQSILELYGTNRPILGVQKLFPPRHGTLRTPTHPPVAFLADEFLAKLAGRDIVKTATGETLVLYEGEAPPATAGADSQAPGLKVDVHEPSVHGPGMTWEELGEEQKAAWKARLKQTGAWTQAMGENVFRGILFGEIAGAVGRAVAG